MRICRWRNGAREMQQLHLFKMHTHTHLVQSKSTLQVPTNVKKWHAYWVCVCYLNDNAQEQRCQWNWQTKLGTQRNVFVARAHADHGQHAVANKLAAFLIRGNPDARQLGQHHLLEHERVVVVNGIQPIVTDAACAELFANGVGRQAEHVHLNVGANFFVAQKLAR